jgi:hypothetical protein
MLAQEHAFFARQATANEGKVEEVPPAHGYVVSLSEHLFIFVFLIFFACGFDVCVVSPSLPEPS